MNPTNNFSANNVQLDFKIPENLKILPNDSAEERKQKRKKLKHLKKKHKNALIERDLQGKKGKWQLFNERSKLKGRGHFMIKKNTQSIFQTSDSGKVGVMGSGKGMTSYREKEKYQFQSKDNLDNLIFDQPVKKLKT